MTEKENRLAHFILDVDMRCNHDGLVELLKKNRIKIKENDFVVFMNRSRTMIKMFCQGKEALLHYKKDGRVLDPGIIPYLPKYCGGGELHVEKAVRAHLLDLMERRRNRRED